jgi:histidinol dehydrogenase
VSPPNGPRPKRWSAPELKAAIGLAKSNIETFHRAQLGQPEPITTQPGSPAGAKAWASKRWASTFPGGSAPLFSTVLMLGVPARLAGCRQVVLCTPANRAGKVHPAILYAAAQVGITGHFQGGRRPGHRRYGLRHRKHSPGRQTLRPGNQYVTAAKQLVNKEGLAIDMPAGPSEVAVYADDSSNPVFVAADLLSQAEHGPTAR